jgi:DNA processing protein
MSPDAGHLAALAGVRALGPRRLRRLLEHHPPAEALAVACGDLPPSPALTATFTPDVLASCRVDAPARDPDACLAECEASGVEVIGPDDERFPASLLIDPDPPAVLFVRGDLAALELRRVGIVGTRHATRNGLDLADELGHDLAAAGVAVVSGLALGIDGAAHRGALRCGGSAPVGVVGNGLDRPYPLSHRSLWEAVAAQGVLLSEWPPGTRPDAFRFPMRNRILAALCEVVVVVESRERGGSLGTVAEALTRSVEVMAVPGSPRSRASAGTNALLRDGAAPVTSALDVAVVLGLDTRRFGGRAVDTRPSPQGLGATVLEHCQAAPATLDALVAASGESVGRVAMALARLERDGWIVEADGWFEALRSRAAAP